jgi:hypothetical protein
VSAEAKGKISVDDSSFKGASKRVEENFRKLGFLIKVVDGKNYAMGKFLKEFETICASLIRSGSINQN